MSTPMRRAIASATFFLSLLLPAFGAAEPNPLGSIAGEDWPTLEALSLYPADVRRHVLEAATEAHVLTELSARQERSRESFRELLAPYDQDIQDELFQLTRYPALVAEIVEGGPKETRELEVIAAHYPEDIRDPARAAGQEHWKLVARAHALLESEQAGFESLVADLPDVKQTAFLALLDTPEVLALLSENTAMTVLLGDAYEREPDAVLAALEALQVEVAERNAEEARDFAEGVAADPELEEEVEASYQEYEQETAQVVNVNVQIVRPYSYWVGVPWWVRTNYSYYDPWVHWYPRPYWRHCGYRFGPRFAVVHGAPRYGFYGWYFSRPVHHHRYPHLSHHILRHHDRYGYAGYRRHGSGIHRGRHHGSFGAGRHAVGRFVRNTEREMPAGFLRAGKDRPKRLAEYGRLHNELRREDRRSGQHRKHGKPGERGRQNLDRVVAKRPGDFPGLAKLAADEKNRWRDRPGKKPGRGKNGHDKWVDGRDTEPQRVAKPKHPAPARTKPTKTRATEPQRRSYKKPARPPLRVGETKSKERWQADRQTKQRQRTAAKQAQQQRRAVEQPAKQRQRAPDQQAKQRQRAADHQAKQQQRNAQKQAKRQQRESQKQAKQQKRETQKQARQQRREARNGAR